MGSFKNSPFDVVIAAVMKPYDSMTGPLIAKEKLESPLDINPPDELIALIPIGLPEEAPKIPPRKDVNEVITFK